MTKKNKLNLALLSLNSLVLVLVQNYGVTLLLIASLMLTIYIVVKNYETDLINFMLFLLPVAPLMKLSPSGFSVYTITFLLFAAIFSYRIRFKFDPWIIVIIVALSFTTLSAKLLIGNNFSLDYVVFFVYLLVLPTYIYHHKNNINFYKNTVFLSVGLIIASLMAYIFKNSGNLRDYIVLLDYVKEDIIRFSGFFGDPNYYSAQILVAITSLLVLILIGEKNHKPILGLLAVMLVGLGFLSASKMFLVILFIISILWLAAIFIIKGRFALRISILGLLGMVAMLVFVFGVFDESIRIYEARFENSNSVSEITTGRSDIAKNYIDYHINNRGYLILGQGLTNKYLPELDDRAAHNTIIQTIYQLGVIGCLLLLAWTIRLFHLFRIDKLKPSPLTVIVALMLGVGYFGSWLFLDMLYLDDYFFTIIVLATSFKFLNEKQKSTRNINRAGT